MLLSVRVFDFPTLSLRGVQNNSMNKWGKRTGAAITLKKFNKLQICKNYLVLVLHDFWMSKINIASKLFHHHSASCSRYAIIFGFPFSSVWSCRLEVKVSGFQSLSLAFHFSLTITPKAVTMFDLQKAERQMVDWMWLGYVMSSMPHKI